MGKQITEVMVECLARNEYGIKCGSEWAHLLKRRQKANIICPKCGNYQPFKITRM